MTCMYLILQPCYGQTSPILLMVLIPCQGEFTGSHLLGGGSMYMEGPQLGKVLIVVFSADKVHSGLFGLRNLE